MKFHYAISGYRWAPESFRASKGLTKQSLRNIPLTSEECCEVGHLFLTKGFAEAVAYVKRLERAKERNRKKVMTYGFRAKEGSRQFVYCPQIYFCADAPIDERLRTFKKIRVALDKTGGRVVVSTQCELDGEYRPMNVQENTVTADFSSPLSISMGDRIFRDGPISSRHTRPKVPKKARAHKRRDTSPGR